MTNGAHPVLDTRAAIVWALTGKPRTLLDLFFTVGIQPTPAAAKEVAKWINCLQKHGLITVSQDDEGATLITWIALTAQQDPMPGSVVVEGSADRHALTIRMLINQGGTAAELIGRLQCHGFATSNGPTHVLTLWLETLEREGVVVADMGHKSHKSITGRPGRVWTWAVSRDGFDREAA